MYADVNQPYYYIITNISRLSESKSLLLDRHKIKAVISNYVDDNPQLLTRYEPRVDDELARIIDVSY